MKVRFTKKQALEQYLEAEKNFFNSFVEKYPLKDNSKSPVYDRLARREAWSIYVDSLQKDGLITEGQAERWANPF